jgi:hypothetical protein
MNITSKAFFPAKLSNDTVFPLITSCNVKDGACVPSANIVEGVLTIVRSLIRSQPKAYQTLIKRAGEDLWMQFRNKRYVPGVSLTVMRPRRMNKAAAMGTGSNGSNAKRGKK